MRKTMAILGILIVFFIIYFLQTNFFNWFTIGGVQPNLFIVLVLTIGLFGGKKLGTILGLFLGLYLDFLTSKSIGITAFLLMGVGFAGGNLDKTFSKESKITIMLIVLVSTAIYEILYYIFNVIQFSMQIEILNFLKLVSVEIVFNILLTIIFYPCIQKNGKKIEEIFNQDNIMMRYF